MLREADDTEYYRDDVLWGCLHAFSYDAQCEGTRASYMHRLVSMYDDAGYFIIPVCVRFTELNPKRIWEYGHFCELVSLFALDGYDVCADLLKSSFKISLDRLSAKRRIDYSDCESTEYLAIVMAEWGIDEWLSAAEDLGKLVLSNKNCTAEYFDRFLVRSAEIYTKKRIMQLLDRHGKNSPALAVMHDEYMKIFADAPTGHAGNLTSKMAVPSAADIAQSARNDDLSVYDMIRFSNFADADEKSKLAAIIESEADSDVKARELSVFCGEDYPGSKEKLICYAESDNPALSETAVSVLAGSVGEEVFAYAQRLLASDKNVCDALSALIINCNAGNKATVLSTLKKVKLDADDTHTLVMNIIRAHDRGIKLVREMYEFAYNVSPCSNCRERVVCILSAHRWLTRSIAEECLYDANSDIAAFVRRYHSDKLTGNS